MADWRSCHEVSSVPGRKPSAGIWGVQPLLLKPVPAAARSFLLLPSSVPSALTLLVPRPRHSLGLPRLRRTHLST